MTVKVGDVVAWDKVPSGALVLFGIEYAARLEHDGFWCVENGEWLGPECEPRWWSWASEHTGVKVTIIALDVPANATADDLRMLAEVFWRPGMTAEDATRLLAEVRDGEA